MAKPPRSDRWGPSTGYLVIALGLVAGVLAAWWPATSAPPPATAAAPFASDASSSMQVALAPTASGPARATPAHDAPAPASAPARIPRVRPPGTDQSPDITDYINDGEKPTIKQVIDRLHAAGVHTG
ncbi:MAG TPA: hypothetical protein VIN75_21840, partial [Burkholderiaceae bacterium]